MSKKTKRRKKLPIQIIKTNPEKGLVHDKVVNHNKTNRIPGNRIHKFFRTGIKF